MDDGNWDGGVCVNGMIVGYSKYPKPPNVRIIRETLKNSKATTRVEYNFSSWFLLISQEPYLYIGLQNRITETINKYILQT